MAIEWVFPKAERDERKKESYFTFFTELVQSHDLYDSYISNCVTENGIKSIYHKF